MGQPEFSKKSKRDLQKNLKQLLCDCVGLSEAATEEEETVIDGEYLPHMRRRKIMTLEAVIPLKARTGIAALAFAAMVMPLPTAADSFVFSTGNPDGLMATAARP